MISRETGQPAPDQLGDLIKEAIRCEVQPLSDRLTELDRRLESDRDELFRRLHRAGVPGFNPRLGGGSNGGVGGHGPQITGSENAQDQPFSSD
jgi:hypothetical protein